LCWKLNEQPGLQNMGCRFGPLKKGIQAGEKSMLKTTRLMTQPT